MSGGHRLGVHAAPLALLRLVEREPRPAGPDAALTTYNYRVYEQYKRDRQFGDEGTFKTKP